MRKLSTEPRALILSALVEGSSMNGAARTFGVSKITVYRPLSDAGALCAEYHDKTVRGVKAEQIQCDELSIYCGCKQRSKRRGARDTATADVCSGPRPGNGARGLKERPYVR